MVTIFWQFCEKEYTFVLSFRCKQRQERNHCFDLILIILWFSLIVLISEHTARRKAQKDVCAFFCFLYRMLIVLWILNKYKEVCLQKLILINSLNTSMLSHRGFHLFKGLLSWKHQRQSAFNRASHDSIKADLTHSVCAVSFRWTLRLLQVHQRTGVFMVSS